MAELRDLNGYFTASRPWILARSEAEEDVRAVREIMGICFEGLRICGTLLRPIVPSAADDLLSRMAVGEEAELRSSASAVPGYLCGVAAERKGEGGGSGKGGRLLWWRRRPL